MKYAYVNRTPVVKRNIVQAFTAAVVLLGGSLVFAQETSLSSIASSQLAKIGRVVFTKHWDFCGAGYMITENLSDGSEGLGPAPTPSSLCMLTVDSLFRTSVVTLLNAPDAWIRDPDVSWDGKKILFSWKKSFSQDDYHLYEMDIATRQIRQITSGLGYADYEGVYLPSGDIVFSSTRCTQAVDCFYVIVSNLYTCDKDGKYIRRLGYDQVHTNFPQVNPDDGTVLYTRWEYNDRGQIWPTPLFQMNPDGSRQIAVYGGNSWFPTSIIHARGIPGTGKIMAILSGHHACQWGKPAIIDPARGREEASGVTLIAPVQKPADNIKIDSYGQNGDVWQNPYPLHENNFIAAFRPDGASHFGLYYFTSDGKYALLASDPNVSCNQPVPIIARKKPSQPASTVDYTKTTGTYSIQDIYYGPGLKDVARGTIKKLRVVEILYRAHWKGGGDNNNSGPAGWSIVFNPVGANDVSWDAKRILGETPVYEDGSAAFIVPARKPVYFQAIDSNGFVVQTMRSWSTLQPGERFDCYGCHESRNDAPPVPPSPSIAVQKGAQPLVPFYETSGKGFSYAKAIQPIWDRKCISCHGAGDSLDLRGDSKLSRNGKQIWNISYLTLVKDHPEHGGAGQATTSKYLNWLSPQSVPSMLPSYAAGSSKSPLVSLLRKGHENVVMSKEEMEKICAWIDLRVPYSGDYAEGMLDEGKAIYAEKQKKRDVWEAQEKLNIEAYIQNRQTAVHLQDIDAGANRSQIHLGGLAYITSLAARNDVRSIELFSPTGRMLSSLRASSGAGVKDSWARTAKTLKCGAYIIRVTTKQGEIISSIVVTR